MKPVIIVLGAGGLVTASRIAQALPEAEIHGFRRRVPDCDFGFDDVVEHVQQSLLRIYS